MMHASDDPRRGWLLLRAVAGVGDATFCRLIEMFGSPEAVLKASPETLRSRGVRGGVAEAIGHGPDSTTCKAVDQELKVLDRLKCRLITCQDHDYPPRLRAIHDPPPVLYVMGQLRPEDESAVAIVGSRRASTAGRLLTERLSCELAALGLTIVSGLARGVDASAHRGALSGKGRTIAVLGCGLDRTYPPEHAALRGEIEECGAVVADLPLGAPPHGYHFPRRNRIISGMSLGVVVTEAAAESGSLITARLAGEQGREVFAVPGTPGPQSGGTNGLIKQGAKLTENVDDVLEELLPQLTVDIQRRARDRARTPGAIRAPLGSDETAVLSLLSAEPLHVDEAIGRAHLSSAVVSGVLLALEIKGLVRQLPGHFFVRI